jgi:hypothetical protein
MTVRKNGTETGTLKTRMGFLIRDSVHHGTGSRGEGVADGRAIIPGCAARRRPQMCNCTSGNLEIPGSRLRRAPE